MGSSASMDHGFLNRDLPDVTKNLDYLTKRCTAWVAWGGVIACDVVPVGMFP